MTSARDSLAAWLRDAHAMEGQAETLLSAQIERLQNYPEALPRLRSHLEETKAQRQALERCLEKLGENTSTLKDGTMKMAANLQGWMHALSGDEVLKNTLASAAFEQFEAASYRMLVCAAKIAGEPEIARTCEHIMEQEVSMADWVWSELEPLTEKYLQREMAGMEAKR
ncbi:ferritin-like domain-containing protein [Hyphomicrobium sp.]|uniref:ferritin-like domain-containing protein n=1 Tax=Hyphomicrobium sp. TaxID=82 RepID=UPI002FDDDBA4